MPSPVLADDCSSATIDEVNVKDCFRRYPEATLGLMTFMFGAMGAAMWAAGAGNQADPDDDGDLPQIGESWKDPGPEDHQTPAYDPAGFDSPM
jgi:hypothetical protein